MLKVLKSKTGAVLCYPRRSFSRSFNWMGQCHDTSTLLSMLCNILQCDMRVSHNFWTREEFILKQKEMVVKFTEYWKEWMYNIEIMRDAHILAPNLTSEYLCNMISVLVKKVVENLVLSCSLTTSFIDCFCRCNLMRPHMCNNWEKVSLEGCIFTSECLYKATYELVWYQHYDRDL